MTNKRVKIESIKQRIPLFIILVLILLLFANMKFLQTAFLCVYFYSFSKLAIFFYHRTRIVSLRLLELLFCTIAFIVILLLKVNVVSLGNISQHGLLQGFFSVIKNLSPAWSIIFVSFAGALFLLMIWRELRRYIVSKVPNQYFEESVCWLVETENKVIITALFYLPQALVIFATALLTVTILGGGDAFQRALIASV